MKYILAFAPLLTVALAQQSPYGQCGGIGWTGPTTCTSGWTCQYSNDWYSQCVQCSTCTGGGAGTTSTTRVTTSSTRTTSTTTTRQTTTSTTTGSGTAATTFCGQWDSVTTSNGYILYNNLWGSGSATSGSQCTSLLSTSGNNISWKTTWSWAGGQYNVKSYANANKIFTPKTISAISTIPSVMNWSYANVGSGVVNVAYDLFTASTSGSSTSEYEIMIWMGAYNGAGPISSTGSTIATPTIGGYSWKLYYGPNGSMKVYSFVYNTPPLTNFSADLKLFLTYLVNAGYMSTSQYLNTVQAGTEPFTGTSATLTVSQFSVTVN